MKKKEINKLELKLAEYIMTKHADDVCSEMNCIMQGYITDILSMAIEEKGNDLTEEDVYDFADYYFDNIDFGLPEDWDEHIIPALQMLTPHDYITENMINRKAQTQALEENSHMYRFMLEELWEIVTRLAEMGDIDKETISKTVLENVQKKLKAAGFDVNTNLFEEVEKNKDKEDKKDNVIYL